MGISLYLNKNISPGERIDDADDRVNTDVEERHFHGITYLTWLTNQGIWVIAINVKQQQAQFRDFDWLALIDRTDIACFESRRILGEHSLSRWVGRLSAKLALSRLTGMSPESHVIEISQATANRGQPLSASGAISISHSGDWVVAAAAPHPQLVGIDVQQIRDFGESALTSVFMPQERLRGTPDDLTQRWSIKEAYLKALGRGLLPHALSVATYQIGEQWFVMDSFMDSFAMDQLVIDPLAMDRRALPSSTSPAPSNLPGLSAGRLQPVACVFLDGYALAYIGIR